MKRYTYKVKRVITGAGKDGLAQRLTEMGSRGFRVVTIIDQYEGIAKQTYSVLLEKEVEWESK